MTHRERHEAEGLFELKKCPGEGFCLVARCRKACGKKKAGLCDAHHQYRWRMRSPKRSAYSTLRDHAIKRGLAFTISYEYFLGMLDCAAYWDHAAESRGEALSIDRVLATEGYIPGNLRVISISLNSFKSNRERYLPDHIQAVIARKRARAKETPELAHEQVGGDADDRNPF